MATIRVGDSTTMYYRDWGEGLFVAFHAAGRRIPTLGTGRCFLRAARFPCKLTCSRSWRRSKGARRNLSS
jgi:hypothetical protein